MEMRCYREIFCISYKDHVTNEEACVTIQQAIRPHEDLTIVKKLKLQWYGCVSHSSGLAKPFVCQMRADYVIVLTSNSGIADCVSDVMGMHCQESYFIALTEMLLVLFQMWT